MLWDRCIGRSHFSPVPFPLPSTTAVAHMVRGGIPKVPIGPLLSLDLPHALGGVQAQGRHPYTRRTLRCSFGQTMKNPEEYPEYPSQTAGVWEYL